MRKAAIGESKAGGETGSDQEDRYNAASRQYEVREVVFIETHSMQRDRRSQTGVRDRQRDETKAFSQTSSVLEFSEVTCSKTKWLQQDRQAFLTRLIVCETHNGQ